jgi:Holliday junction DNA helicase RuvB
MNNLMIKLIEEETTNISIEPLKDIIGQGEAVKKILFFLESHSNVTPIPSFLLTGSQGLGKTYTARKIADCLNRELIEVNCGTIETDKDFVEGVLFERVAGKKAKTILFDEAHKLSSEITTILLSLLNTSANNKNYLVYKGVNIEFDLTKINVIFATTDAYRLFPPLLNRCVEIYFNLYTNVELYKILKYYIPEIAIECNRTELAYTCRGRARDTYILASNIKRYCGRKKLTVLNTEGLNEIKDIFSVHKYGLTSQEMKLLKFLQKYSPISCQNIAINLGVNERNVEEEIEIRPKELGLIMNTSRGRCLSKKGLRFLKELA